MIFSIRNVTSTLISLTEFNINIAPDETIDLLEELKLYEIQKGETLLKYISTGDLIVNNGSQDLSITEATRHMYQKGPIDEVDITGKPVIHQTSRPIGHVTCWMGRGDNLDDLANYYGEGNPCIINHRIGEQDSPIYIDFFTLENKTYLHEGYVVFQDCQFDRIKCQIVPQLVSLTEVANTNYMRYNGIVIPAAGNGDVDIDSSKIVKPNGGLVAVQINEHGERLSAGFWNANWNTTTKQFENIAPAPNGDGGYNMFYYEMVFSTFVVDHLVGSGNKCYQSSDVDEFTHGLRIRIITETCGLDWTYEDIEDHPWRITFSFTLNRQRLS